jgi:hypothetical protein
MKTTDKHAVLWFSATISMSLHIISLFAGWWDATGPVYWAALGILIFSVGFDTSARINHE